ncbi:cache domain-containing protein [Marinospirillum sp.]|uniref:sensor histidine kinase n=1 Tax=Marinospirillum sp. TaxID=2183934 RepID=UPI003A8A6FC4
MRIFFWQRSVRGKLLALTLLPILLTLLMLIGLTAYWTSTYTDRQLYMKVAADLAVARNTLHHLQERQLEQLLRLSSSWQLIQQLQPTQLADTALLEQLTTQLQQELEVDFLRLLPTERLHLFRTSLASIEDQLPLLASGESVSGLLRLEPEELQAIDLALAQQAQIPLRPTPHARPTDARVEDRALVVRSLVPLFNLDGEVAYLLDAGLLLNHNLAFVDQIRDLVYGPGTLPEDGIGSVTLFLGDTRISTNVTEVSQQGQTESGVMRAIGTRISAEVAEQVLDQQRLWLDRAFVVHDWYISAYEPIYDLHQELVGVLYTGFSEGPFIAQYRVTLSELGITLLIVLLVSAFLVWHGARRLFIPVEQIHRSVMAVRAGQSDARIGLLDTQDEMADLAHQFDQMMDELDSRQRTIQAAAQELERQVEARTLSLQQKTQDLEKHIQLLKATRAQLFTKEKLAVLGELTAGIAHEINNPAAVILGHMDLLQVELGDQASAVQQEIDTVIEQVYRIRAIINNLLQYSRPGSTTDQLQTLELNPVVQDTLALVRHALDKQRVEVQQQYQTLPSIQANRQQLQQVLVNLLINAANALDGPGQIQLSTQLWQDDQGRTVGAMIQVKDHGRGMTPEVQARIFEPFFTTRENGNGLGLSVSLSLIRRYGGDIQVESEPGRGSCFRVYLLSQAQINAEDEATMRQLLSGLGVV